MYGSENIKSCTDQIGIFVHGNTFSYLAFPQTIPFKFLFLSTTDLFFSLSISCNLRFCHLYSCHFCYVKMLQLDGGLTYIVARLCRPWQISRKHQNFSWQKVWIFKNILIIIILKKWVSFWWFLTIFDKSFYTLYSNKYFFLHPNACGLS